MGEDEETTSKPEEKQRPCLECRADGADHQREEEISQWGSNRIGL
jgi:hypothetical protein